MGRTSTTVDTLPAGQPLEAWAVGRVSRLVTRSLHRVVTDEGLVIGSQKRNVLGVTLDAVSRDATVASIIDAARERNDVQYRRAVKATGG